MAKIPEEDVLKIRELYYREGYSMNKLSKMFKPSMATIRKAIFGMEAYRDISDDITEEEKEERARQERARIKRESDIFWL